MVYEFYQILHRVARKSKLKYYKKKGLKIGKSSFINEGVEIFHPQNVVIGDNVHINAFVHINAGNGKVTIGNNVTVSSECSIIASGYDLDLWCLTGQRKHFQNKEIYIGDDVWLCSGAIILPGVKITGKNVVVAAGAVVTKDITEDFAIYGGVPAKKIKMIDCYEEEL